MGINQKDIKLLWGRSGNRCAICKKELTQNKKSTSSAYNLGEQAHIVGDKMDAARGKSPLNDNERNSYHNLILLCPNDHTTIDANPEDWPVEKLHQLKSEHELWVKDNLSTTSDTFQTAKQLAVTNAIDKTVSLCMLDRWTNWTSHALSPDPKWSSKIVDQIFELQRTVISTIWPDEYKELESAIKIFSLNLNESAQTFLTHCDLRGDYYFPNKFYKHYSYPECDNKALEYDEWLRKCYNLVIEATKGANWFADIVRRDINPLFFVENGKFLTMEGDLISGYEYKLYEYSMDEKKSLLQDLSKD